MIARYSAWRRQMEERLAAFSGLNIGYPKGVNGIVPPLPGSAQLDRGLSDANKEALKTFYSVCDGVSLPDVGEGIFVDSRARVARKRSEYTPTTIAGRGWPILVFGSFGDGALIVMKKDTGEILRLPLSKIEDDAYLENMRTPIQVLAPDLSGFLEWILMSVPQSENMPE